MKILSYLKLLQNSLYFYSKQVERPFITLPIKTSGFYLYEVCYSSHTYTELCLSVLNLFPATKESGENDL